MQVLFNRSILSILSDALNFARHWIRSKNPTIQNIDSRRFTDLIALDTSQFHFFLSFFFLLHCPMNTTRETFSIILSQSSMLERKEKGKHPEQQRSIDPRFKKKKKFLNYRQLTRYTTFIQFKFHRPRFPVFVHRVRATETHQIYIFIPLWQVSDDFGDP